MSNQILKEKVPNDILFNFLNSCCELNDNKYYIFDINSYKKAVFLKKLDDFLSELIPYYYLSKQYYLKRQMNYNKFVTIIRQICNKNVISFTSKIKYMGSGYNILYYIYV